MEKKFSNLGKELSRSEQKEINGAANPISCGAGMMAQYDFCIYTPGSTQGPCRDYARAWYINCLGAQQ